MGTSILRPFALYNGLENRFESAAIKPSMGYDEGKAPLGTMPRSGKDSEPTTLSSKGFKKMMIDGSFRRTSETEPAVSVEAPSTEEKDLFTKMDKQFQKSHSQEKTQQWPILDLSNPKREAAIKLQKVYKSFRTRRKLADCAVLVEQSWWKLLDFAELKRSSISFFDNDKHETALSRWSRARTRAAKVGKGLSKNSRAQKLALQHWLEAIDPRHRYGHNLHFYYVNWLHCQSKEPFFYWLDIGEGKEVNLVDKCPRSNLQQECIKYLGPMERKAYEVVVEDGKLIYKQSGELLDSTGEPKSAKWIFVLSTSMALYVGQKKKGTFQHSSFLAGGATSAAGRIVVEKGLLKAVWPHSGHYQPTPENFQDFISFLRGNNVDLTDVKMDPLEEEEESFSKQNSFSSMRSFPSVEDLAEKDGLETEEIDADDETSEETHSAEDEFAASSVSEPPQPRLPGRLCRQLTNLSIPDRDDLLTHSAEDEFAASSVLEPPQPRLPGRLCRQLTNLSIPDRDDLLERLKSGNQAFESSTNKLEPQSSLDGYETEEESSAYHQHQTVPEQGSVDDQHVENAEESIPEESIPERINSLNGMNTYQLGMQLCCKWTTGVGPRISCVRDYPSELQFRALEQVNLSPRSANRFRASSSRDFSPNSFSGEIHMKKTSFSGELPWSRCCTPRVLSVV